MTLVFGQKLFQGLILIADSRTTFFRNQQIVALQDNAQKIFRLGEHSFIAFCGDFEFAEKIISFLFLRIKADSRFKSLHYLCEKGPKVLRYAYNYLAKEKNKNCSVSFILGGVDFSRPARDSQGRVIGVAIFDRRLLMVDFLPSFNIKEVDGQDPLIIMGSGEPALDASAESMRNMQFQISAIIPLDFHAFMAADSLKTNAEKLGILTVGGLFQIVVIDSSGSRFVPYQASSVPMSGELDVELGVAADNHHLIQRNLKTGKEIPLLFPGEVLKLTGASTKLFAYQNIRLE